MKQDNGLVEVGNGIFKVDRTVEQRKIVYIPSDAQLSELLFTKRDVSRNGSSPALPKNETAIQAAAKSDIFRKGFHRFETIRRSLAR